MANIRLEQTVGKSRLFAEGCGRQNCGRAAAQAGHYAYVKIMEIYCCGCGEKVNARLTDGAEIYPQRLDLCSLPFWKCDSCGNHVGCHHKTKNKTRPLGCIPTPEIKNARKDIHKILDPIWKSRHVDRKTLYGAISEHLGWTYHTANIRSIGEARKVFRFVRKYA